MFKNKKVLAVLLAILMLVSIITPIAIAIDFDDIGNTRYNSDIQFVTERGIMAGMGGNRFAPYENLSRAMFAVILWRMEGEPDATTSNPFSDVANDGWYSMAIRWARESGIANGTSATTFDPHRDITRQEVVTMFSRYIEWSGHSIDVSSDIDLYAFTDRYDIASWAVDPMIWAIYAGVIDVTDSTTLNPSSNATRGEIASMVVQMIELVEMLTYERSQSETEQEPTDTPATEPIATPPSTPPASGSGGGTGSGGGSGTPPSQPPPTPPEDEDYEYPPEEDNGYPSDGDDTDYPPKNGDNEYPPPIEDDFILTISVAETSVPQGQHFQVYAELKNNSGQDLEIIVDILFWPSNSRWWSWYPDAMDWPPAETILFLKDGVIRREPAWSGPPFYEPRRIEVGGGALPDIGTHELFFGAVFYIACEQGVDNQRIVVSSNTVEVTVLPPLPPPTTDDFILTISVEETSLPQGKSCFRLSIELKNNSGQDLAIAVRQLFLPYIPSWRSDESYIDMRPLHAILFRKNSVIRHNPWVPPFDTPTIFLYGGGSGYYDGEWVEWLPVGVYELSVRAVFYILCEYGSKQIELISNTVEVTVLPPLPPPTADDFILTISVEETTLPHGEGFFRYYVELKNNSGRDLEIIVDILFWPGIPNWRSCCVGTDMPELRTIHFPNNSFIRHEPWSPPFDNPSGHWGGGMGYYHGELLECLPVGTHEFRVGAGFYIVCDQGGEPQRTRVLSNIIKITILPSIG